MNAPSAFAEWMCGHIASDKKWGRSVFHYHPRSDEHSKKICQLVLADLTATCPLLAAHARDERIVGCINAEYHFPNGKVKNIDLAIGTPRDHSQEMFRESPVRMGEIEKLRIACEAKQTMTEHSKSKPRLFDELSSSHEIVHQGDTNAIAAGIVVLNIADSFASPTRQVSRDGPLVITPHKQPGATQAMVKHLRGLKMRDKIGEVGFDAFAVIVLDCDNVGPCKLYLDPPAPQPGDLHHYETFIRRISAAYLERFG